MIFNLFKRLITALESRNIQYMLSGSIALNNYVIPRMTMDIDVVIEMDEQHLADFLGIFKEGYYLDSKTATSEIKKQGMFNVIDHATGLKIDFIIRKETEYRKMEFSRRLRQVVNGIESWMVTPEDLIISKLIWIQKIQSEKQLRDIESLLNVSGIDREYIKDWCNKLHLNTYGLI